MSTKQKQFCKSDILSEADLERLLHGKTFDEQMQYEIEERRVQRTQNEYALAGRRLATKERQDMRRTAKNMLNKNSG